MVAVISWRDLQQIRWLDPWVPLTAPEGVALERELAREVSVGHGLWGRRCVAVASCPGDDDVLFLVDDETLALVHLTWHEETSTEWPWTVFFADPEEFARHMAAHEDEHAPRLTLSDAFELELRLPEVVERTGLYASQHLPGDPPFADAVDFTYFDEARLHEVEGRLWIEVRGGSDGDGARLAGEAGWYARCGEGQFELRPAPDAPRRELASLRIGARR